MMNYIATYDEEYLEHWGLKKGEEKEGHKYISREWKNNRWVYYYNKKNGKQSEIKSLSNISESLGLNAKKKWDDAREANNSAYNKYDYARNLVTAKDANGNTKKATASTWQYYYKKLQDHNDALEKTRAAEKEYKNTIAGGKIQRDIKDKVTDAKYDVEYAVGNAANGIKNAVSNAADKVDTAWNTAVTGRYYKGSAQSAERKVAEAEKSQKKNEDYHNSLSTQAEKDADKEAYYYWTAYNLAQEAAASKEKTEAQHDYLNKSLVGKGEKAFRELQEKFDKFYDESYEDFVERVTGASY